MASPIAGIDPQYLEILKQLAGQMGPNDEDKRAARQQAAFAAAAGLLSNMYKPTGMGIGAGVGAGLLGYNNELKDRTQQRGQNLVQAGQIQALAGQASRLARQNQFSDELGGGGSPQGAAPAGPASQSAPGLPQIPAGSLPGVSPSTLPQVGQAPAPRASLKQQLLDIGVPAGAISTAAASADPVAAVGKLFDEYSKPVFGQGKIPLQRTASGYKAVVPEGFNDALGAQALAEARAAAQAKNETDIVTGTDAQGRPVQGYARNVYGSPPVAGASQSAAPSDPLATAVPQNGAEAAQLGALLTKRGVSVSYLPQPGGGFALGPNHGKPLNQQGGGNLVGPDPVEQAARLGGVATSVAQDTEIAKDFGKTYTGAVDAEMKAPANIQKFSHLKDLWSKVETGKLAPTVTNLQAIARYVAPDLAKSFTDQVPYQQAATALSNAMALELRNPAGGAGMPGSLSDSDRKYLQSMISSAESDPKAIPMILDAKIALEQRNKDIGGIMRAYRKANGKIDEGVYQEIANYSESHPLFPKEQQQAAGPDRSAVEAEMKRRGLLK